MSRWRCVAPVLVALGALGAGCGTDGAAPDGGSSPRSDGAVEDAAPGAGNGSGGSGGALGDSQGPCPGCRIHVPPGYSPSVPVPLLVALHGDEGRDLGTEVATGMVIDAWSGAADDLGVIVLAIACPASQGCNGAWSDWLAAESYAPSAASLAWLDEQVDVIEQSYDIDLSREALAGYSGGAYWLGYYAPARATRFSGVAFVAGGMPAYHAYEGCPSCLIPGYFLGGDMDFRTAQMSDTANAFVGCGQEATTDLVVGGDHQQTISSLTSAGKAATIISWLEARPLACP